MSGGTIKMKETIEVRYSGEIPSGVRSFLDRDSTVKVTSLRPLVVRQHGDESFLERLLQVSGCEGFRIDLVKVKRDHCSSDPLSAAVCLA